MSIRLMTIVWDISFPTQSQKLIMLKLADYASDSGGSVFPANETLADKVGCDERTVQRSIRALKECGILRLMRAGGGKPGSTNEWQLNVFLLNQLAAGTATLAGSGTELQIDGATPGSVPPVETPGNLSEGVTNEAGGVTPVSLTPDTGVTQSVINHQIEPSRAGARASETARLPARKHFPQFRLTPADSSWGHWLAWLTDNDRRDLVVAAQEARQMVVTSRWPTDNSPMPSVDGRPAIEKRKQGDAA